MRWWSGISSPAMAAMHNSISIGEWLVMRSRKGCSSRLMNSKKSSNAISERFLMVFAPTTEVLLKMRRKMLSVMTMSAMRSNQKAHRQGVPPFFDRWVRCS